MSSGATPSIRTSRCCRHCRSSMKRTDEAGQILTET